MLTVIFAVFEIVFNFLFAAVKFLLRILAYFGLIIPLFYFLLMLIINLILGGAIFDTPLYNTLYIVGLVLSFVLCVLYFVRTVLFKKKAPPKFAMHRRDKNPPQQYQAEQSPLIPSGNIIQERVFKDPNGNIVQERTFQLPDNDKYRTYPAENNIKPSLESNVPQPALESNKYDFRQIEGHKAQLKPADNYTEEPEIYRVKNNKQYIIKEYSDRVEVYKETDNGYEFIKCDYK